LDFCREARFVGLDEIDDYGLYKQGYAKSETPDQACGKNIQAGFSAELKTQLSGNLFSQRIGRLRFKMDSRKTRHQAGRRCSRPWKR
jgi:hypothetical protein